MKVSECVCGAVVLGGPDCFCHGSQCECERCLEADEQRMLDEENIDESEVPMSKNDCKHDYRVGIALGRVVEVHERGHCLTNTGEDLMKVLKCRKCGHSVGRKSWWLNR